MVIIDLFLIAKTGSHANVHQQKSREAAGGIFLPRSTTQWRKGTNH